MDPDQIKARAETIGSLIIKVTQEQCSHELLEVLVTHGAAQHLSLLQPLEQPHQTSIIDIAKRVFKVWAVKQRCRFAKVRNMDVEVSTAFTAAVVATHHIK